MKPREQDEYTLVVQARGGDRDALAALVERLRLWLFATAYAEMSHYQDAQDVVAAALERVCLHIGDLREPERLRAWVRSVVQNEAHRLLQKRAPACIQTDFHEILDEAATEEISLLRMDVEQALHRL